MKFILLALFSFVSTLSAFAEAPKIQKIPLQFRAQPRPGLLAKVSIRGREFLFLVDTGGSAHSLDENTAKELGYQIGASVPGSSPYGDSHLGTLGTLHAKMNGFPFALKDSLSTKDDPGGLLQAGIFGALSPPKLAENALVVVDVEEPALYVVQPVPANISKWLSQKFSNYDFDEVPRLEPRNFHETIHADAGVFGELTMFLDTGATTTHIYSSLPTPHPLAIRVQRHICETMNVRVLPLDLAHPQSHLLGMDCLRGKILAFAPLQWPTIWMGSPQTGRP